jgi:transcription elongation factor Elf1
MQTVKATKTFEFQCPKCSKTHLVSENQFFSMSSKTGTNSGAIAYISCECEQEMIVRQPAE